MPRASRAMAGCASPAGYASKAFGSALQRPVAKSGVDGGHHLPTDEGLLPYPDAAGTNGRGGANSYLVNGKMTVGFAFVAYPAEYRSTGVMTSIVGSDEVAYQQDLRKKTGVIATAMKRYDTGAGWHKAKEAQEETARVQETK